MLSELAFVLLLVFRRRSTPSTRRLGAGIRVLPRRPICVLRGPVHALIDFAIFTLIERFGRRHLLDQARHAPRRMPLDPAETPNAGIAVNDALGHRFGKRSKAIGAVALALER